MKLHIPNLLAASAIGGKIRLPPMRNGRHGPQELNRAEGDGILDDAYELLIQDFATESGKSKGHPRNGFILDSRSTATIIAGGVTVSEVP